MRTEHLVHERMPHGYYFFPGLLPEGEEAFAAMEAFLSETLDAPGTPAEA